MLNNRRPLCFITDLHGNDAVIELLWRWPIGLNVIWISRIDADRKRVDPDDLQHCSHQVGFVLAVAIRLCKDLGRYARSITAASPETCLDRYVLNILNVM